MDIKKKRITVVSCIAAAALIGATYAAYTASSGPIENRVSASGLKIEIEQKADKRKAEARKAEIRDDGIHYTGGMPGDEVRGAVSVRNTESRPCYIRVTINRSWKNEDGTKNFDVDPAEIEIIRAEENGWLIEEDPEITGDPEVIYCYYKEMVPGGQSTSSVMEGFSLLKDSINGNSNQYHGLKAEITFSANAVQTTAAEEAMLAEWGIEADITKDGVLTGYKEQ